MSTDPNPSAPLRLAVTQAAATGHEILIVGFGAAGHCGLCDAQMLNASWVAWFKSEVEFAASKGIGISACTRSICLLSPSPFPC